MTHRPVTLKIDLFHLKWVAQDKPSDYGSLVPEQYFNHFQNHKELTSKSFLKKSLDAWVGEPESGLVPADYLPLTYDLSFPEDFKKYIQEYYLQALNAILKKHVLYFMRKTGKGWLEVEAEASRLSLLMKKDDELKERIYFDKIKPTFRFVNLKIINSPRTTHQKLKTKNL